MNYDSAGRFTTEKAKMMLRILRQHVPHIYWDFDWGWDEDDVGHVNKYSDICVPAFQLDEAEYIIGRLENGEDLFNYKSDRRFPVLFEKENGDFRVVKPLSLFADYVYRLIDLLEKPYEDDLIKYLHQISKYLLNIYILQYDLPDCAGSSYYQPSLSFSLPNKLDPFSIYHDLGDPFAGRMEIHNLEKTLENILEVLYQGIVHYDMYQETGNHKYLSIAASVWKNQYSGEYGWGTAIVNSLKVIHYASMYLQKGKLPNPHTGR